MEVQSSDLEFDLALSGKRSVRKKDSVKTAQLCLYLLNNMQLMLWKQLNSFMYLCMIS